MKFISNNLAFILYSLVFAFLGQDNKALSAFANLKDKDKEAYQSNPIGFLNKALGSFIEDKRRSKEDKFSAAKVKNMLNSSRALAVIFASNGLSDEYAGIAFEEAKTAKDLIKNALHQPDRISRSDLDKYAAKGAYARRVATAVNDADETAMSIIPEVDLDEETDSGDKSDASKAESGNNE